MSVRVPTRPGEETTRAGKRLAQGTETAPERHRRRAGGDDEGSLDLAHMPSRASQPRLTASQSTYRFVFVAFSIATAVPLAENQRVVVGTSVSVSCQVVESSGEGDKAAERTWRKASLIAVLSHLKEMEWLR